MRRKLKHLSILLTAATTFLSAQSPRTSSAAATNTLKTNAQIVILDVVVTDKNKKAVHNLKASDFNVLDSGTPQTISHFEEHVYPNPKLSPAPPTASSAPGAAAIAPSPGPVTPSTSSCSIASTLRLRSSPMSVQS